MSSEVDSRKYQHLMIESMSLVCGDLGNVRLKGSRVFACFSPFTKTHLHHTVLSERFPKEYHNPITLPFLSSQTATVSDSFQFVSDINIQNWFIYCCSVVVKRGAIFK